MIKRNNVELHRAFFFTCDECGRDTFVRGIKLEPESELYSELTEAVEAMPDFDSDDDFEWMLAPEVVTCSFEDCNQTFETSVEDDE